MRLGAGNTCASSSLLYSESFPDMNASTAAAAASTKGALLTVVTGQDTPCFAELLLGQGHEVHDVKHPTSPFNTSRLDRICLPPSGERLLQVALW